jgi:hypothetical protein
MREEFLVLACKIVMVHKHPHNYVSNNFILVKGSNQAYGIYCGRSSYLKIYHNSINVTNNNSNSSALYLQITIIIPKI